VPAAPGLAFETWETTEANRRGPVGRGFNPGKKRPFMLFLKSIHAAQAAQRFSFREGNAPDSAPLLCISRPPTAVAFTHPPAFQISNGYKK
jgi:hypothetical protein